MVARIPSIHLSLVQLALTRQGRGWRAVVTYTRAVASASAGVPQTASPSKKKFVESCFALNDKQLAQQHSAPGSAARELPGSGAPCAPVKTTPQKWWREQILRYFQGAPLSTLLFWRSAVTLRELGCQLLVRLGKIALHDTTSTPRPPCLSSFTSMVAVGLASMSCARMSATRWSCDGVWTAQ